jgi:hypothetical protein
MSQHHRDPGQPSLLSYLLLIGILAAICAWLAYRATHPPVPPPRPIIASIEFVDQEERFRCEDVVWFVQLPDGSISFITSTNGEVLVQPYYWRFR